MIPFAGAVLTGGRSTRMGRDKATLPIDGVPMGERVAAVLRAAGATEVVAVGGAGVGDLRLVPDDGDGGHDGPMAGIRAAMRSSGEDVVVVLACDMPDVTVEGILAVVDALAAAPEALAAVPVLDGRLEPLHVAWRRAALDSLPPGVRAVHQVLASLPTVEVPGLDPAWLKNLNEPGDLPR